MTVPIPAYSVAPVPGGGPFAREWYAYLKWLGISEPAPAELPEYKLTGNASVVVSGVLSNGVASLSLVGDTLAPAATSYYGANGSRAKGWHLIADALAVTSDLTKSVGATNVSTFGLADLADSGTGTFKLLTRDAKGRLSGTADGDDADVPHDNAASGLEATDVQAALVELAARNGAANDVQQVIRSMRDGGTVKIVCLGDSITYGQLDTGGQATTPWPSRLQSLLQQYYDNANITVVNAGVPGNTVAAMIARFAADVRAQDPDLIIFNGGTNDSREANSVSLGDYLQNCRQVLSLCNPTPVVIVGVTPRFKEHRSAEGEGVIHFYRESLRQLAVSRGIPYVDLFARLHALYKARAYAAGYLSKDGSHYSEDGYRYIGDTIFASAFANDDLFIKPGQFKDARGQWLITEAADSTWGGATDNQDANAIVVSNATIRAYLFLEDWTECALALHCLIDRVNSTGQAITFNNQSISGASGSFTTSPKAAGATNWYAQDYAVVAARLRPGLNNIQLSTTTAFRLTGFSVVPRPRDGYLVSYNPDSNETHPSAFWTAARWRASAHDFEYLRDGVLVVSNNASGFLQPLCDLIPDPVATTSRWRMRATVFPNTIFYFGQQSTNDVDYMPVYSCELDGVNAVLKVRDHANTQTTAATVALAVAAGGTDIRIDLKSGATGWTLWINGTLIYADDVPLSAGPMLVSAGATRRSYWNPPIKKGKSASDTGVLIGEEWTSFVTGAPPVRHLVDDGGTDRTLTYV